MLRPFFMWLAIACTSLLSCPANAQAGLSAQVQDHRAKAEAGDIESAFRLGSAYDSGDGAPRDAQEAMKWYRYAAEKGLAEAQNSVGSGLQAAKQYAQALTWYEQAAAQNHAQATNNLAYLHDLGLGVKQDRKTAFALYSKAADLGSAEAMWNIANMHGAGQLGGPPDLRAACTWVARAERFAAANEVRLKAALDRIRPYLSKNLSAEELANCQESAQSWQPALAPK